MGKKGGRRNVVGVRVKAAHYLHSGLTQIDNTRKDARGVNGPLPIAH